MERLCYKWRLAIDLLDSDLLRRLLGRGARERDGKNTVLEVRLDLLRLKIKPLVLYYHMAPDEGRNSP